MVTYATQSTKRFQWEDNSKSSQSWNCGPTCATFIAGYYRGYFYGIEKTRLLIAPPQTATSCIQQRDMLNARGVPSTVKQLNTLAEMHSLVDSGRRPIIVGIQMSRVPSNYRDHPFLGWHAVVVMSGATNNGVRGFWVNDPNFSPAGGIRPDPDRGMKWYPDWVMQAAFLNNTPRWTVVPNAAKPLPVAPSIGNGRGHVLTPPPGGVINIRTTMSTTISSNIYARAMPDGKTYRRSDGKYLWLNISNYVFYGFSGTNAAWANVKPGSGTPQLYISRPLFEVTRWP